MPPPFERAEHSFFRRLFLRRYALLLQKVEQTYPHIAGNSELYARLRTHILNLTWIDAGVDRLYHYIHTRSSSGST